VFEFPVGKPVTVIPVSDSEFAVSGRYQTRLSFTLGTDGRATGATLIPAPGRKPASARPTSEGPESQIRLGGMGRPLGSDADRDRAHSIDPAFDEVAELDRPTPLLRRLLAACYGRIISLLWSCSGCIDIQGDPSLKLLESKSF
jgi:hypothetical protein